MSGRVIGANLVVSIKTFSREKSAIFFTIAFPIILILVFGTIFLNQDNPSFDLYVQDLDQTDSSAQLVKTLDRNGKFKITTVDPALNATQYAKDKKLNFVLVIPKGYEKALVRRLGLVGGIPNAAIRDPNASVTVTYIYDASASSTPTKIQLLQSGFAVVNQGMSGQPPFIRAAETSMLTTKFRFIDFFVPGIIAMGSPDELIERNANYLVHTLKAIDRAPFEIIQRMRFEPVHDNHQTLKVRVEHTDDIQKLLNALKDAGAVSLALDVRKPNLEAVFLKLTGEALREGSVEGVPE